jgi:hypothetical protein
MESDGQYVAPSQTFKWEAGSEKKGLANADACPVPWSDAQDGRAAPRKSDELLVIQMGSASSPEQTLSLVHRKNGGYRIRSTRPPDDAGAETGPTAGDRGSAIRLDEKRQAARLRSSRSVKEMPLDGKTAKLLMQLWHGLASRAQIVQGTGIPTPSSDGTAYQAWQGGRGIVTRSPKPGSVLGLAVTSAERLEQLAVEGSPDMESALKVVRFEMENALQRTRDKEPCLEPAQVND